MTIFKIREVSGDKRFILTICNYLLFLRKLTTTNLTVLEVIYVYSVFFCYLQLIFEFFYTVYLPCLVHPEGSTLSAPVMDTRYHQCCGSGSGRIRPLIGPGIIFPKSDLGQRWHFYFVKFTLSFFIF